MWKLNRGTVGDIHKWDERLCATRVCQIVSFCKADDEGSTVDVSFYVSSTAEGLGNDCRDVSDGEGDAVLVSAELYEDTYWKLIELAVEQFIEKAMVFVEYWEEDELVGEPDGIVTKPVKVPPTGKSTSR